MKLFRPRIRSKNFSCDFLRPKNKNMKLFPVRSLVRLGSRTPINEIFAPNVSFVEVNSLQAVDTSRSKLSMKAAFAKHSIPQSEWYELRGNNTSQMRNLNETVDREESPERSIINPESLPYPIVAKRINGFKGIGMRKLDNVEELNNFIKNTNVSGYYFERFYNYSREYRIHATRDKVILRWRKLRTSEAEERWFFNNSNCNWIGQENELFQLSGKLLDSIDNACIEAVKAVGLDIGAIDVRVQSASRENPAFIILEVNSAPRMGTISNELYARELENIIQSKIDNKEYVT